MERNAIKNFQQQLKCNSCFYSDMEAFNNDEPCCTYMYCIDPYIKNNKCEKHRERKNNTIK